MWPGSVLTRSCTVNWEDGSEVSVLLVVFMVIGIGRQGGCGDVEDCGSVVHSSPLDYLGLKLLAALVTVAELPQSLETVLFPAIMIEHS